MLFTAINLLRGQYKNLGLAIVFTGEDEISVVVTPTLKPEVAQAAPHLASPFVLKGNAADLDAGFAGAFDRFAEKLKGLEEQTQAQLDAATVASKAAAEAKKTSKPVVPGNAKRENASQLAELINTGTPTNGELGEDDEENVGTTPPAETSDAPKVLTGDALFD
jgi:PRTRC genetic system protein E